MLFVYILTFVLLLGCASSQKYIDLTHPFDNGYTISWPKSPKFNLTIRSRGRRPSDGLYYESNEFSQVCDENILQKSPCV